MVLLNVRRGLWAKEGDTVILDGEQESIVVGDLYDGEASDSLQNPFVDPSDEVDCWESGVRSRFWEGDVVVGLYWLVVKCLSILLLN